MVIHLRTSELRMFTSPLVALGLKIGSAREPQTVNMQQSGTETIPTLLVKER
jgi:hypothetical protein